MPSRALRFRRVPAALERPLINLTIQSRMIAWAMPAIRDGSPLPRFWSAPLNQFQHFEAFDGLICAIGITPLTIHMGREALIRWQVVPGAEGAIRAAEDPVLPPGAFFLEVLKNVAIHSDRYGFAWTEPAT